MLKADCNSIEFLDHCVSFTPILLAVDSKSHVSCFRPILIFCSTTVAGAILRVNSHRFLLRKILSGKV